jgi:hypothetical protein
MKILYVVFACITLASCARNEVVISPQPGDTYKLKDPVADKVIGTLVFDQNGGYLITQSTTIVHDHGSVNATIKTIGHWYRDADEILLHDQIYQSIEVFDRWGNPLNVSENILEQIREAAPLPDCRKVTLSGSELLLL